MCNFFKSTCVEFKTRRRHDTRKTLLETWEMRIESYIFNERRLHLASSNVLEMGTLDGALMAY